MPEAKAEWLAKLEDALNWQMRWGGERDFLFAIYERDGEMPQALLEEPELEPDEEQLLQAFLLLNGVRMDGFSGPGTILLSDMETVRKLYGFDSLELRDFVNVMLSLDRVVKKWYKDRAPAKT